MQIYIDIKYTTIKYFKLQILQMLYPLNIFY